MSGESVNLICRLIDQSIDLRGTKFYRALQGLPAIELRITREAERTTSDPSGKVWIIELVFPSFNRNDVNWSLTDVNSFLFGTSAGGEEGVFTRNGAGGIELLLSDSGQVIIESMQFKPSSSSNNNNDSNNDILVETPLLIDMNSPGGAVGFEDLLIKPAVVVSPKLEDSFIGFLGPKDPTVNNQGSMKKTLLPTTSPTTSRQQSVIFAVRGMTCAACVSTVQGGLTSLDGVSNVKVNLLAEKAEMQVDSGQWPDLAAIGDEIEDMGFEAELLDSRPIKPTVSSPAYGGALTIDIPKISGPQESTLILSIEGMTCAACVASIESGLYSLGPGIKKVSISLLANRGDIIFDPTVIKQSQILASIDDLGFEAMVLDVSTKKEGISSRMSNGNTEDGWDATTAISDQPPAHVETDLVLDPKQRKLDSSDKVLIEGALSAISGVFLVRLTLPTESKSGKVRKGQNITLRVEHDGKRIRDIMKRLDNLEYPFVLKYDQMQAKQMNSLERTHEKQKWKKRFYLSLIFALPHFFFSMLLMGVPSVMKFRKSQVIPGLSAGSLIDWCLTTPIQFYVGREFYRNAWKALKHGSATMDVLVVTGTSIAYFYSLFSVLYSILDPSHPESWTVFDTSTMLITFVTMGRYLENVAKGHTSTALTKLMSLKPNSSVLIKNWETSGPDHHESTDTLKDHLVPLEEEVIGTDLLQLGDVVKIGPADKIPCDGTVLDGHSTVDESMITGESLPVVKHVGSSVIGGTLNNGGVLYVRVDQVGQHSTLSKIIKLVEDAQTSKAPIQAFADQVSGVFVPTVLVLGLLTFLSWLVILVGNAANSPIPPVFQPNESRLGIALKMCISVIVIACPCALGLATPTAIMVGTGVGAQLGILIKGGVALEKAQGLTTLLLDKTGTLTTGKMKVYRFQVINQGISKKDAMIVTAAAEYHSEHPLGKALVRHVNKRLIELEKKGGGIGGENNITLAESKHDDDTPLDTKEDEEEHLKSSAILKWAKIERFEAIPGSGLKSCIVYKGVKHDVLIGNMAWLKKHQVKGIADDIYGQLDQQQSAGLTVILVACDGELMAFVSFSDQLKKDSLGAVRAFQAMGLSVVMVTGDQKATAQRFARELGIDQVIACCTPDRKAQIVNGLQEQGQVVGMIGDGINDSPALAQADIGFAVQAGTDIAMETASIILMRDNLLDAAVAIHLSRNIVGRIHLNFLWACLYNVIGIPIAAGFFVYRGLWLEPMMAGSAMALSSVSVICSSLLLKRYKAPTNFLLLRNERKQRGGGFLSILLSPFYAIRDLYDKIVLPGWRRRTGGWNPLRNNSISTTPGRGGGGADDVEESFLDLELDSMMGSK